MQYPVLKAIEKHPNLDYQLMVSGAHLDDNFGNTKRDFVHVYDIVDGLIKIAFTDIKHSDAWELGTGVNYSVNELFKYFKDKFDVTSISIPDQPGNYRQTLRENDDSIKLLDWKPKDRLKDHINSFN